VPGKTHPNTCSGAPSSTKQPPINKWMKKPEHHHSDKTNAKRTMLREVVLCVSRQSISPHAMSQDGIYAVLDKFASIKIAFPALKMKAADVMPHPTTVFRNLSKVASEAKDAVAQFFAPFLGKVATAFSTDMYSHPKTYVIC
jgi:hypothetical protein